MPLLPIAVAVAFPPGSGHSPCGCPGQQGGTNTAGTQLSPELHNYKLTPINKYLRKQYSMLVNRYDKLVDEPTEKGLSKLTNNVIKA